MATPFLKWAGGKRGLLPQLTHLLPDDVAQRRYREPFLGGGSMFFHLQPRFAWISDANAELMTTYIAVQSRVEELIDALTLLAATYDGEGSYYAARDGYNLPVHKSLVSRAALFIYLNRTCFNGLYRVNKSGGFNVPCGKYKNPRICDPDGLRAASAALQHVRLSAVDYYDTAVTAQPYDFIYWDPPYAPLSATSNFVGYTEGGFGSDDQLELRQVFGELHDKGCKMLLSNSDTPEMRDLYAGFEIHAINAPRAVGAAAETRKIVGELAICNY